MADLFDRSCVFWRQVGILVQLGLEPLDLLEVFDEGCTGRVALEVRHRFWAQSRPCDFMKESSFCTAVSSSG